MANELKTRITTAILFGAVFIPLVLYNEWTLKGLLVLLPCLMVIEYFRTSFRYYSGGFSYTFGSLLLCLAGMYGILKYGSEYLDFLVILGVTIQLLNVIWLFWKQKVSLQFKPYFLNGFLYLFLPFGIYFLSLEYQDWNINWFLMCIFFLLWASDSGAYFSGKKWGKRKLFPVVSPGKTWEGFLGGGISAVLISIVIGQFFTAISLLDWIMIALLIWIFGTTGDLIESKWKRYHKIKDSGNFLPGHGGFFDRFDSFVAVLAFVTAYIIWIL